LTRRSLLSSLLSLPSFSSFPKMVGIREGIEGRRRRVAPSFSLFLFFPFPPVMFNEYRSVRAEERRFLPSLPLSFFSLFQKELLLGRISSRLLEEARKLIIRKAETDWGLTTAARSRPRASLVARSVLPFFFFSFFFFFFAQPTGTG